MEIVDTKFIANIADISATIRSVNIEPGLVEVSMD